MRRAYQAVTGKGTVQLPHGRPVPTQHSCTAGFAYRVREHEEGGVLWR